MSDWVMKSRAAIAGDVGGDHQVSEAYVTSWVRRLPRGLWGYIGRQFYIAHDEDKGKTWLECQIEYLVCTNPRDVGSSEQFSDMRYVELPVADPQTAAARSTKPPTDEEFAAVFRGRL
jgi:hypothetical protein